MVNYVPSMGVLIVTNRCGSNCEICGNSSPRNGDLPEHEMQSFIDQAYDLGIKWIEFSGGEPLLRKDSVLKFAAYARSKGMESGLTTSSCTYSDRNEAYSAPVELKDAGIKVMDFSLDKFHQDHVPYENVLAGVEGALFADMDKINIRSINTKSTKNETRQLINRLAGDIGGIIRDKYIEWNGKKMRVRRIEANREGKARNIDKSDFVTYYVEDEEIACSADDITIMSNGDLVPCCSFCNFPNEFYHMGNIRNTSLEEFIKKVNESPLDIMFSPIGFGRIKRFLEKSDNERIRNLASDDYSFLCEFCSNVMTSPTLEYLEDEIKKHPKEPQLLFREVKGGQKVTVVSNGNETNILDYMGPLCSRDFWIESTTQRIKELDKRERNEERDEFRKKLEHVLERARKIKKWQD